MRQNYIRNKKQGNILMNLNINVSIAVILIRGEFYIDTTNSVSIRWRVTQEEQTK